MAKVGDFFRTDLFRYIYKSYALKSWPKAILLGASIVYSRYVWSAPFWLLLCLKARWLWKKVKCFFFRSELCFWGLEGYKNLPVVPLFIDFFRRRKNLLSIEIMQYVCSKVHKYETRTKDWHPNMLSWGLAKKHIRADMEWNWLWGVMQ